jgi:predicted DNA-binding transcriptional regulator AlpA
MWHIVEQFWYAVKHNSVVSMIINGYHPLSTAKERPMLKRAKEAADQFSISVPTLYRWRQEEGFPQPVKRGQVVLYDTEAIRKWLEKGEGNVS